MYLRSSLSVTNCRVLCRWLIEADAGRRVNLTLYDFTSTMTSPGARDVISGSSSSSFCRRLAVVRDVRSGRETNVCSGTKRLRHAYVSDGSRLEVVMATGVNNAVNSASDAAAARFLIRYEGRQPFRESLAHICRPR